MTESSCSQAASGPNRCLGAMSFIELKLLPFNNTIFTEKPIWIWI